MLFLNEYEIEEAQLRFHNDPVLGAAAQTLANLKDCANQNSDGWCYWPKPARAANQLQELIRRATWEDRVACKDHTVTAAQVRKAYAPIKSFLTRSGLTCKIVEPK